MRRALILSLFIGLLVACSTSPAAESEGGSVPAAASQLESAGGGGGSDLVAAALAITDVCTVLPTDLVAEIVPDGGPPEGEQFPPRCSVYGSTSVVQITLSPYDAVDPLDPAETVSGLGTTAYLQRADAQHGYIKVILSPDAGALYVEVVSDNERDPGEDAIAVAEAVLAMLQ